MDVKAVLKEREVATIKLGLERMEQLDRAMQYPHRAYPTIHVAGTNGKGSVVAMLEAVFCEAGDRVGSYTSPHLLSVNERIRINGIPVSDAVLQAAFDEMLSVLNDVSYFELLTELAFVVFRMEKVDVAIIETGLGGRLDATNVIVPKVCAITSIALEHEKFLGSSLEQIAREKAGIIKENIPVVCSAIAGREVIEQVAEEKNAPFHRVMMHATNLLGEHQKINAGVVTQVLAAGNFSVNQSIVEIGLQKVVWPCRLQFLAADLLCDAAHNLEGMKTLIKFLEKQGPVKVIAGFSADKDIDAMMFLLQEVAERIVYVPFSWRRSWDPQKYVARLRDSDELMGSAAEAVDKARGAPGLWVVAGSLFLLGEVLQKFGFCSNDLFDRDGKAYKGTLNWRGHGKAEKS